MKIFKISLLFFTKYFKCLLCKFVFIVLLFYYKRKAFCKVENVDFLKKNYSYVAKACKDKFSPEIKCIFYLILIYFVYMCVFTLKLKQEHKQP